MFDEYANLYGRYFVISSKISITPVEADNTSVVPSLYGVYRDTDATLTYPGGLNIVEDQRNKGSWGIMGHLNWTTGDPKRLLAKRTSFNAKRDLGVEGQTIDAPVTGDPPTAFSRFYQIWSASLKGNNPGISNFLVQIDYVVRFTDPLHVTAS